MEIEIGEPTNVAKETRVEHKQHGLVGLPEELQKSLTHILTKEEKGDGKTMKAAENFLLWNHHNQEKVHQNDYVKTILQRVSSGSSGDTSREARESVQTWYVPTPAKDRNERGKPSNHQDVSKDHL